MMKFGFWIEFSLLLLELRRGEKLALNEGKEREIEGGEKGMKEVRQVAAELERIQIEGYYLRFLISSCSRDVRGKEQGLIISEMFFFPIHP